MCSITGLPATGASGFGRREVSGRKRDPSPPAISTPFMRRDLPGRCRSVERPSSRCVRRARAPRRRVRFCAANSDTRRGFPECYLIEFPRDVVELNQDDPGRRAREEAIRAGNERRVRLGTGLVLDRAPDVRRQRRRRSVRRPRRNASSSRVASTRREARPACCVVSAREDPRPFAGVDVSPDAQPTSVGVSCVVAVASAICG